MNIVKCLQGQSFEYRSVQSVANLTKKQMGYGQGLAVAFLSILVVFVLVVRNIFLPPHLRKAPNGKRWKMSSGPKGVPFFGNLLQYKHARRDEVELRNYVSHKSLWLKSILRC